MKTRLIPSIVLSAAMMLATPVFAGSDEVKVQWADVPAAAQKTIQKLIDDHTEGGKIKEIERKTKTRGGKNFTAYEAEVGLPDGGELEIEVREDGKLMEFEYDRSWWSFIAANTQ